MARYGVIRPALAANTISMGSKNDDRGLKASQVFGLTALYAASRGTEPLFASRPMRVTIT